MFPIMTKPAIHFIVSLTITVTSYTISMLTEMFFHGHLNNVVHIDSMEYGERQFTNRNSQQNLQ